MILAVLTDKRGYFGNGDIGCCFRLDLIVVDDDLGMEDLRSSKLSATEPTNMPCVRLEIFEAGISVSNCVLVEVVTFSFDTECDSRSCTILPKRSDKVRAVSPTTCPEKILPTVLVMTLASFSP